MTTSPFGTSGFKGGPRGARTSSGLSPRRLIESQKRTIEEMERRRRILEMQLEDLGPQPGGQTATLDIGELIAQAEFLAAQLTIYAEEVNQLYRVASEQAQEVGTRTAEATRAALALLERLDPDTERHSRRVARYAEVIARRMDLTPEDRQVALLGGLLHDIGFVGRPQAPRQAPDDALALALYRQHPIIGARIVRDVAVLEPALPVVLCHHERPDGLGFPRGMSGQQIPLHARIVAVANAYDGMITRRPFSPHIQEGVALLDLRRNAGTRYDRRAVEALVQARYERSWRSRDARGAPQ